MSYIEREAIILDDHIISAIIKISFQGEMVLTQLRSEVQKRIDDLLEDADPFDLDQVPVLHAFVQYIDGLVTKRQDRAATLAAARQ